MRTKKTMFSTTYMSKYESIMAQDVVVVSTEVIHPSSEAAPAKGNFFMEFPNVYVRDGKPEPAPPARHEISMVGAEALVEVLQAAIKRVKELS